MSVSRTMEEIWRIKEESGSEMEGKTDKEIITLLEKREPEWSKALPRFDPAERAIRRPVKPIS